MMVGRCDLARGPPPGSALSLMWKATVTGIFARKVRLALTTLAVLLGVSFVTGTYVLTDTLDHSYQGLFHQRVSGIDLVVRQRAPFGGSGDRDRFPDTYVATIGAVPGVRSANPFLQDYAQFVDRHGDSIQTGAAGTYGVSWSQPGSDGPLQLVPDGKRRGHAPHGPHQVAMDASTAKKYGFHVGDEVRVLLKGPAEKFHIVALFGFGDRQAVSPLTFAAFDVKTAQRVFAAPKTVDAVNVVAQPGETTRALRTRIARAIGPGFEVQTAQQFADDIGKQVLGFLDLLTQLLLGFATIGLVVGAFIIVNTFTILVAQRTREFGVLRAMGASGRQVVMSVVTEAAVVGTLAAVAGLVIGVGLAAGLLAVLDALGRDVPGSLVLSDRTIILSLVVGIGVTVGSSAWPAVRAARIPPMAAINDVLPTRTRPSRVRPALGLLLLVVSAPLLAIGLSNTRNGTNLSDDIWLVALGALAAFFGVVLLLATFAAPLADLIGRPLRRIEVTGALARGNAMRNPRRTAATASALVIGLGLVGLIAIFGDSAKASVNAAVDRGIRADFVLKAQQFAGFSPQVAQRLRALPEVGAVASFRFGNVRVDGNQETVTGVEPSQLGGVVDLRVRKGSVANLGTDGVLVFTDAAREYHLHLGDSLTMQFPRGFTTLRVSGIYAQEDFTGGLPVPFVVPKRAYDDGFGTDQQDSLVYVKAAAPLRAARGAIERALGHDFPNIQVFSRSEYRDDQQHAIDRFLAVTVALLFLSELIAVLGIVNTLALSVYERSHELGVLRAIGMSRRQVRRMVRSESAIIALIGGIVGSAVGLLWGWAFATALRPLGITQLHLPAAQLAGFIGLSVLAGMAAALAPAWRAARIDMLPAIAAE
jgi:putative ABC transport system permease protein